MSVQQYVQATGITNAGPDDYFYELTTGIYAGDIVRITQVKSTVDLDDDGAPDRFTYKIHGAFVTSDNQQRTNAAGTPWKTRSHVHTLEVALIASDQADEEINKGEWRAEWVQHTVNLRVILGE